MSASSGSRDPFPRDRFTALLRRLPGYARLSWHLARDERLSRSRRAALLAGAAYLVSPVDLVPGIIPVAGQLDDALVVLLAIRLALAGLPVADRAAVLVQAGLDPSALEDDVRTIGATYAWIGRQGARITWRTARTVGRGGSRIGRSLIARVRREA